MDDASVQDDSLSECFMCPICFNPMDEIAMCDEGHSLCMICQISLPKCPFCDCSFSKRQRNVSMEKAVKVFNKSKLENPQDIQEFKEFLVCWGCAKFINGKFFNFIGYVHTYCEKCYLKLPRKNFYIRNFALEKVEQAWQKINQQRSTPTQTGLAISCPIGGCFFKTRHILHLLKHIPVFHKHGIFIGARHIISNQDLPMIKVFWDKCKPSIKSVVQYGPNLFFVIFIKKVKRLSDRYYIRVHSIQQDKKKNYKFSCAGLSSHPCLNYEDQLPLKDIPIITQDNFESNLRNGAETYSLKFQFSVAGSDQ